MYTKENTNNWRNMPGPGDPETWGPCTNHPNDPRTPDAAVSEDELHEARLLIAENRVNASLDWVFESFSEAPDEVMRQVWEAFLAGDTQRIGKLVEGLIEGYVLPSEEAAAEALYAKSDLGL
jgi:hypothetical protein